MDRFTKFLLALIAAGLWANVAVRPAGAQAPRDLVFTVDNAILAIANGQCANRVLCGP